MFRAFIYCNTAQSKCHKTQMFIFISYSAHFTGWHPGWEQRRANCCGCRLLHFDFYIQLLFLHTNVINETALWISELSKFAHNKFLVFKRCENLFLKTIRQSQFEANVKVKLPPSVVVRTSFEIFRALFDVRPCMRRLSQDLQIECKTWRIGV